MARRYTVKAKDSFRSIALAHYGEQDLARPLAGFNGYLRARRPASGTVIELPARRELVAPRRIPPGAGALVRAPTLVPPHGLAAIIDTFGDIERCIRADGTISPRWESQYIVSAMLPFAIPLGWGDPPQRATRIRCHKLLAPILVDALNAIDGAGLRGAVKTYGGCYNFRSKRTGTRLSTHSWGIAVDLNPNTNAMGTRGDMDARIVAIFRARGFKWGGDWTGRSRDPMHFQFCTGY
jgi:hypothetical protein